MLTTASQFGPRARSLRTTHVTATATVHRVLGASGALTVQQYQQTRDFRFGSWFSISPLDSKSEIQEKIRRHEQTFKQRYLGRDRYSDWDKHPLADDARHAMKRMMASYWLSHDARPCGRHRDTEPGKQRTSDNKNGVRPGQNIEDVERGAMEHLIFGEDEEGAARGPRPKRKRSGKKNKHNSVPHTFYGIPEEYDDYFIDPVTNRRVAKHPAPRSPEAGVDIPVKTFKDYRTRFISSYGAPSDESPGAELPKHNQVEIETSTEYPEEAPRPSGKPLPDNLRHKEHAEAQDIEPKYDNLHKYKPVLDDVQVSSERPQQLYNDLDKYKPVTDKEPIQFEDLKPPYEDLDKYNAAVVDEIVARFESDKAPHSDLHRFDQASDLVRPLEQDTESKYNDLDNLRPGVSADITAQRTGHFPPQDDLDNHRPLKDNEPHGKPLGPQVPSTTAGFSVEYQPSVENLEPGDFPLSTVEKLREKYGTAELRKYTAVRHFGAEQNSSPSAHEQVTEWPTEKYEPEELAKYKPVYHNEPDGNPLPRADERLVEDLTRRHDPEELAKYPPVYWHEPDGQPAAAADSRIAEGLTKEYDPAELAEYKPVYWNEPDGQPLSIKDERTAEGLTKNYEPVELEDYKRPVRWNEPDGQPSTGAEEPSNRYTDLDGYGPVRFKEPEDSISGQVDAAKEGLEEMDARRDYTSPDRLAPGELDKADESSPEVLRRIGKNQQIHQDAVDSMELRRRFLLISQMKKYQAASDATDHEASLAVKFARARVADTESERQLTGNYVRDFPEEFEKSWTETLSTAPTETAQQVDEYVFESQDMDGGLEGAFGRPSPVKIQPALDRHLDDQPNMVKTSQEIGNGGSDSKSAQDLNNTHANEFGGTPRSRAHIKHDEGVPEPANKGMESTKPDTVHHESTNEPTLYKILAYDPTMQKIEIAETSSFVPDTASALTPADALLRLSHPTRFFPHFGPLQSEGYEIISGTGDVLVFRKVRPQTRKGKQAEQAPVPGQPVPAADERGAVETRINPIDMTGMPRFSPASANFASPTGYVNYDNIPETAASKLPPPPPKIKYNIDVHREEPVFSGPKARIDGKKGKKKGLGKRLIVGGVWVAGISYALGVVSEYFTTGGIDGMGPKGF